jgi:hypothetical protein
VGRVLREGIGLDRQAKLLAQRPGDADHAMSGPSRQRPLQVCQAGSIHRQFIVIKRTAVGPAVAPSQLGMDVAVEEFVGSERGGFVFNGR